MATNCRVYFHRLNGSWCLCRIGQTNIKRLMAYSSIGHMGYALVGLSTGTMSGVSGVILYMVIYSVMTLGTFACILAMRTKEGSLEDINDLAGLAKPIRQWP